MLKKIKARYIGRVDPEYTPGKVYNIFPVKDFPNGEWIGAENEYGESYLMRAELFVPIEDENKGNP